MSRVKGMTVPKSSVEQIRERFDNSVERLSNLETGNTAQVDSVLSLQLIAQAAASTTPEARNVLDVGCGAGNYTIKLLEHLLNLNVTLLDLSTPMLERARERVGAATSGTISLLQGDIREVDLGVEAFDVILASAVLHHLREDWEWEAVFAKLYAALRPGGSLWIYDLVEHAIPGVNGLMMERYGEYLTGLKDEVLPGDRVRLD